MNTGQEWMDKVLREMRREQVERKRERERAERIARRQRKDCDGQ